MWFEITKRNDSQFSSMVEHLLMNSKILSLFQASIMVCYNNVSKIANEPCVLKTFHIAIQKRIGDPRYDGLSLVQ